MQEEIPKIMEMRCEVVCGFSKKLREYRKCAGMTQEELAKRIGISRTGYADLEKEGSGKTFEKLPMIAKALNLRIDDLFPEMDEPGAAAPEDDVNELDELVI